MAYGIQVFNQAGATLLDSELQTSIQVPYGPTSFATGTSFTKQAEEIILYNRAANGVPLLKKPFGSYTITLSGSVAVNRISVRQTDEDTPPASGTYGINIYDAGGTLTKTFSDSYARSFTIIGIFPTGTIFDGAVVYSGSTTDIWVGAGSPDWGSTWRYNQFNFSTTSITFVNYINFLGTIPMPNFSPVIVAKIRS